MKRRPLFSSSRHLSFFWLCGWPFFYRRLYDLSETFVFFSSLPLFCHFSCCCYCYCFNQVIPTNIWQWMSLHLRKCSLNRPMMLDFDKLFFDFWSHICWIIDISLPICKLSLSRSRTLKMRHEWKNDSNSDLVYFHFLFIGCLQERDLSNGRCQCYRSLQEKKKTKTDCRLALI